MHSLYRSARFNPCFNGFMDKDIMALMAPKISIASFNPCFNGFMDKDMEHTDIPGAIPGSFNPCFNGFMDKDMKDTKEQKLELLRFQPLF